MNSIIVNDKKIWMAIAAVIISLSLYSCVSDDLVIDNSGQLTEPWNDPNLVPVPIGLSFDASTRNGEDIVDGTYSEHEIDFDTQNECYAIFFYNGSETSGKKYVKYIAPLYLNKQLTDLYQPLVPSGAEYTVFAVAYVPKDDVPLPVGDYKDENEWQKAQEKPKISDILVVLNGGKIYQKFFDAIYDEGYDEDGNRKVIEEVTDEDILNITWDNPMIISEHQHDFTLQNNGTIGLNAKGLFTMTNSAYYEHQEDNTYKLRTLRPLTGNYYVSIDAFLAAQPNNSDPTPNASVQLERMVAKFTQPALDTEVYGSQRFFRPSDNVPHLVVYDWNGEDSHSQEIDWRIHLLGWTINGSESSSYVFKKLPEAHEDELKDWNLSNWNSIRDKRSFWSIDPHYYYDAEKTDIHENDFYPWQYRKAADLENTVSWEAAVGDTKSDIHPVLRYNTFNEIGWPEIRYVAENTYDQDPNTEWKLDNRTELLAGPHLLLTGEIYLKGQESVGSYLPSFGPVAHLYCDRIQRYYLTELDFFKMFVTEFARSVSTQWTMTFPLLDWHEPSHKIKAKYQTNPQGEYQLFFRAPKDMFEDLNDHSDETALALYEKIMQQPYYKYLEAPFEYDEKDSNGNYKEYYFWSLSFPLLDALQYMLDNGIKFPSFIQDKLDAGGNLFSTNAQIYQGDGRMIPWLEHIHVRKLQDNWEGTDEFEHPLIALEFNLAEGEDSDITDEDKRNDNYRTNIYKSFIKEWWGPLDHFAAGRMYYAGSIQHQNGAYDHLQTYYGTVRNHWYKFTVTGINGLGTPVDDPNQPIIPDKYAYKDQMTNHTEVVGWHLKDTEINFGN